MASHLARFAAEAGIKLRTIKAQLLEPCGKVERTIGPFAESYREADHRPTIVEEIICIVERRLRKARSFII